MSTLRWILLTFMLHQFGFSPSILALSSSAPVIQLSSVEEEQPANTKVANLREELAKRGRAVSQNSIFAFYDKRSPINKLFSLKRKTGELSTRIRIDRDFLCSSQDLCCPHPERLHSTTCPLSFLVKVLENIDKIYLIRFSLEIIDLNDNTPKFPSRKIYRKIMENLSPGVQIQLPLAEDQDSGSYGVVAYELAETTEKTRPPFKLMTQTSENRITHLSLVSLRSLNREVTPYYIINLTARDGDFKSDTLQVNITVEDDNDCSPVFVNESFVTRVKENILPGSVICQVKANDCDIGENGRITYSLSPSSRSVRSMFSINSESGEVTLNSPLDHEQKKEYSVIVEARDNGQSQGRSAKLKYTVMVEDINDSPPRISVTSVTDSRRVEIPENEKANYVLATVDVNDPDDGKNGRVYCELKDTGNEVFHLGELGEEGAYKLISTVSFDREKRETYDIIIECTDSGNPPQKATKRTTVTILDKNDNSPIFHPASYTFTIFENNKPNQIIGQVIANDLDTGINGRLTYQLDHTNRELVRINPVSGMISAAVSFDRENIDRFQVKVIARDGGRKKLSATATVTIVVKDVNDNSPHFQFYASPLRLFIREDTPVNTVITRLNATDADAGLNGQIVFHLVNMTQFFRLTRDGRLSVQKPLDRESRAYFRLLVEARDQGSRGRVSSAVVLIDIVDVNDNAPRFIFPSENSEFYSVNISVDFVPGKTITRIVAADRDTDDNSVIRYRIIPQNESFPSSPTFANRQLASDIFLLEEVSGELKLNRRLDGKQLSFILKIEARDQGEPSLSTTRLLSIKVLPASSGQRKIRFVHRSVPGIVVILVAGLAVLVLVVLLLLIVFLINRRLLTTRANAAGRGRKDQQENPPNYDEIVLDHKQIGRAGSADLLSQQPMLSDSTSLMTLSGKQLATLQRDRTLGRRDPNKMFDDAPAENAALLLKMKQFNANTSSQGHPMSPEESSPSSLDPYQNDCPDNEDAKYSSYLPYHRRINTTGGLDNSCLVTMDPRQQNSTYYQLHRGGIATLQQQPQQQQRGFSNTLATRGGGITMTPSSAKDPGSAYTSLATGKPVATAENELDLGDTKVKQATLTGKSMQLGSFPSRTLRYPYDDISHV